MDSIADQIHKFILENFLFGDETRQVKPDDSFLDKGIVDSTGVLELIAFVEENFHIAVGDGDLLPENFDSINNLTAYVIRSMEKGS